MSQGLWTEGQIQGSGVVGVWGRGTEALGVSGSGVRGCSSGPQALWSSCTLSLEQGFSLRSFYWPPLTVGWHPGGCARRWPPGPRLQPRVLGSLAQSPEGSAKLGLQEGSRRGEGSGEGQGKLPRL